MARLTGGRLLPAVVALLLALPPLLLPGSPAQGGRAATVSPVVLLHTVGDGAGELTLRLTPVPIHARTFEVLVERTDGTFGQRRLRRGVAYLGTVDGRPGAVAVAARGRDGILRGQVVADRGATTWFTGHDVTGTRGTTPPASYRWPSASDPARNRTVSPGQVGDRSHRWVLGYDVDASTFTGAYGGSVRRAVDALELTTVELLATYERDARLRPAVGRIVLRRTPGPYAGGPDLGAIRTEWTTAQADTPWDTAALLHDHSGGGVAYVGTLGSDWSVSSNGSDGDVVILRHELGHNWGPHDNHTNGPEGPTIESGNQYARFDGTEVRAILLQRDEALAGDGRTLTPVRALPHPIPPYAALDLVDGPRTGYPRVLRPTRNDHDANGDRVQLVRVARRSHLGARLTVDGGRVTYVAPDVIGANTLDWFTYVAADGTGRRATGVVLLRVDP